MKDGRMGLKLWLRLTGRRLLATWLCILRHWAGKWSQGLRACRPMNSRAAFLVRNQALQEELRRVFAPYHRFCPDCGSLCCREAAVPFSEMDAILYGRTVPAYIRGAGDGPKEIPRLWLCFRSGYLEGKLRQFTRPQGNAPAPLPAGSRRSGGSSYCPALQETGCSLPWGTRPAICVFCACPRFLQEMNWRDFGRYGWVNLKYLTHLTLSLRMVRSEGRRPKAWLSI